MHSGCNESNNVMQEIDLTMQMRQNGYKQRYYAQVASIHLNMTDDPVDLVVEEYASRIKLVVKISIAGIALSSVFILDS